MYSYVKAQVLPRVIGSTYEFPDLQLITIYEIFNKYREIYIELFHPAALTPIYMDFLAIDKSRIDVTLTLTEWLIKNANKSIPSIDKLPLSSIKYIHYQDAIQSGYKFTLAKAGRYNLNDIPHHDKTSFPDIQLTRPRQNTDMPSLHRKTIVTVNGYMHLTDTDGKHLWVLGATKSMLVSGKNTVGILSFMNIGDIEKQVITGDNISKDPNYSLYDKLYLTIPNTNNKAVMLSIFGYMQLEDKSIFYRVGDNVFVLHLNKLPLIERVYEATRYGATDYLELVKDKANPGVINVNELLSDAVILKLMTAINSFITVIPVPYLHTRKVFLRQSKIPGSLLVDVEPRFPLLVGYGKIGEYWKRRHRNVWVINVADNYYNNLLMSYLPDVELEIINDSRRPGNTYGLSHGYMLELGG